MSHLVELEFGAAFLALWLVTLVALWFLADRKTRPGPIRSVAVIEGLMLVSITSLILGLSFTIWGSEYFTGP